MHCSVRRHASRLALAGCALVVTGMPARAQEPAVSQAQLGAYAGAYVAIGKLRDRFQAELAEAQNKKPEAQQQLRAQLRQEVANVLQQHSLTQEQFDRITWIISTDAAARRSFDRLIGVPPPAADSAAADSTGAAAANPHLGHVLTGFAETPGGQGLLAVALAEAGVVAQHAALAARDTSDLDAMRLHAGHVLHAIEAAEGVDGPGSGYGLRKAAVGVATHIDLAARAADVPESITTHAVHVATAARNTVARADEIAALAKQVRAATSAMEAAPLVRDLNEIATTLLPGEDANGDGRIGWEHGEGGLAHVEQHLELMRG